jgi:hypothetical protein
VGIYETNGLEDVPDVDEVIFVDGAARGDLSTG